MVDHIFMAFLVPLKTIYTPWTHIILWCSKCIPKKHMFIVVHDFWPQTRVHQDVCINPNIFGVFLIWVQRSWLFSFHMPWYWSYSTLYYPFGVLYKEPLGYIKEEELKSNKTIVLLQLQLFSPNFLNFGPSFWFYLTWNHLDSWTLFIVHFTECMYWYSLCYFVKH